MVSYTFLFQNSHSILLTILWVKNLGGLSWIVLAWGLTCNYSQILIWTAETGGISLLDVLAGLLTWLSANAVNKSPVGVINPSTNMWPLQHGSLKKVRLLPLISSRTRVPRELPREPISEITEQSFHHAIWVEKVTIWPDKDGLRPHLLIRGVVRPHCRRVCRMEDGVAAILGKQTLAKPSP